MDVYSPESVIILRVSGSYCIKLWPVLKLIGIMPCIRSFAALWGLAL